MDSLSKETSLKPMSVRKRQQSLKKPSHHKKVLENEFFKSALKNFSIKSKARSQLQPLS